MDSKKAGKSAQRIRSVEHGYRSPIHPTNFEDQKQRFFREGKAPEFVLRGSSEQVKKVTGREKGLVRFDHLEEAERILNMVKSHYGDGKFFLDASYGPEISKEKASRVVTDYISSHNLEGSMTVTWCSDLACSATMMWQGPALKYNRPEARRYSLWLSDSRANSFLRERGITSLLHHEIGTHFFRMHNDGLQPWFSDRRRFGLMPISSRKLLATEEGLASINTVLDSRVQYLWTAALLYYAACKAEYMSFRELFEHLEKYISDREHRWKHCIRVKRGLEDVNVPGGYGKDQCYFEGALQILHDVDNIDFTILMAGKICKDEVQRCKRLARTDIIRLPQFMADLDTYKRKLRQIARMNGIANEIIPRSPTWPKGSTKGNQRPKTQRSNGLISRTASVPKAVSEAKKMDGRETSTSYSASGSLAAWNRTSSATPQPFRYTHTPMSVTSTICPVHEASELRAPSARPNTATSSTQTPGPDRYVYSRGSSFGFSSSLDVKSPRPEPLRSSKTQTTRVRSLCAAEDVPEVTRYSQRMLHRKKYRTIKSHTKRRRKGLKKAKTVLLQREKTLTELTSDDEENSQRFGCLRLQENKKE